jgi:hypothetical protein
MNYERLHSPDDVHTKPAKPAQVRADVHRKAGKSEEGH